LILVFNREFECQASLMRLKSDFCSSCWNRKQKKTWEDWLQWLADLDCPLEFEKPLQIPNQPFSFQTWLNACDQQLNQHPDWQARLTTPVWLKRQQIPVIPKMLKGGENKTPGITEISGLQTELTRMIDQIHTVQQRIANLETGSSQRSESPAAQTASKLIPATPEVPAALSVSGLSDPLGRPDLARTLERELQMHSKIPNAKGSGGSKSETDIPEPEIVKLKDAYLSYNRWCDQFDEVHLDLQEFVKETLRVASSHQISFQQFRYRILKNAKEVKQLESVLESFSRLRSAGVDINLAETESTRDSSQVDSNS